MEGVFPFTEKAEKVTRCFTNVFSCDLLSPRIAMVSGIENYPACLVALMIWHCWYRTKTFEVCGPRIYKSENKLSPLVV